MKAMKQPLSPKVAPQRDADNHVIYVDRGRVAYDGRGGNDVIAGYQDNDTLKGGDGDDVAMLSPNRRIWLIARSTIQRGGGQHENYHIARQHVILKVEV